MVEVPSYGPAHSNEPGLEPVPSGHATHAATELEPTLGLAVLAAHRMQEVSVVADTVVLYLP
jgi:hypothetical protein